MLVINCLLSLQAPFVKNLISCCTFANTCISHTLEPNISLEKFRTTLEGKREKSLESCLCFKSIIMKSLNMSSLLKGACPFCERRSSTIYPFYSMPNCMRYTVLISKKSVFFLALNEDLKRPISPAIPYEKLTSMSTCLYSVWLSISQDLLFWVLIPFIL